MVEGPIGAAAFNNEFGRPGLGGFFRVYEQTVDGVRRGFHKPIMSAGGLGTIGADMTEKIVFPAGTLLVQIGGPGMRIGMGGGAASSMAAGANAAELDFDSVQRGNPEIERRAQEVVNHCWSLGDDNPVLAIHDVGAGGLSNAFPELVDGAGLGARFDLSAVPLEESGLAPKEAWCNESQERYVVALAPESLPLFAALCERERCPYAVVGVARDDGRLVLGDGPDDRDDEDRAIDMPMEVLLGKPPRMTRDVTRVARDGGSLDLDDARPASRSRMPCCGTRRWPRKRFLVTIADRTVGGLTHRDQMVGPWQVPVADVAVTLADHVGFAGEAMATGERMPIAAVDAPASGRMAVGEALTNLLAAPLTGLAGIKLSCNWMAACGEDGEDAALYDTVEAVAMRLLPELGVSVPVGKDSLSMRTRWTDPVSGDARQVTSPVSLVVTAFASLPDVRGTWTPQLRDGSALRARRPRGRPRPARRVDRSPRRPAPSAARCPTSTTRSGCSPSSPRWPSSVLAESIIGLPRPLRRRAVGGGVRDGLRRSRGVRARRAVRGSALRRGARGGARRAGRRPSSWSRRCSAAHGLAGLVSTSWARTATDRRVRVAVAGEVVLDEPVRDLAQAWDEVSSRIAALRDNPACAEEEHAAVRRRRRPRARRRPVVRPRPTTSRPPTSASGLRPKVAILREQGVNSHVETAFAFDRAGFDTYDVHMTDLQAGRFDLADVVGLVACGGFSYGDTLGAGEGWARSVLFNERLTEGFHDFFHRDDTFGLGICNGCQMFAALADLIPGAEAWPRFTRNRSEQYEARLTLVEVLESPSILTAGMAGSRIPIAVAHGEGFADFSARGDSGAVPGWPGSSTTTASRRRHLPVQPQRLP